MNKQILKLGTCGCRQCRNAGNGRNQYREIKQKNIFKLFRKKYIGQPIEKYEYIKYKGVGYTD